MARVTQQPGKHTVYSLLRESCVTVFVERGERLKCVGAQCRALESGSVLLNLGLDKPGVRVVPRRRNIPCRRNILAIINGNFPKSAGERVDVLVSRRI